jgi:iron complex transport system ATP-binding protein
VLVLERIALERGGFGLSVQRWQARGGELHALLGRNGAGKSTLLRVIAGEMSFAGSVRLHGRELGDWSPLERARHLAVLPQASQLSFGFSAAEVVRLGATPLTLGWRELGQAVERAMAFTDCAGLARQPYPKLSGGEKQRVHLARVLLQLSQAEQPPLLLLDEPTSAQDLGQQHGLLGSVRELCEQRGMGVVAVLHDLNQSLRYAHCCSLVDGGRLVAEGAPADVLTPATVRRYWGYPATRAEDAEGRWLLA